MEFIHPITCRLPNTLGRAAAESFAKDVERGLPTWEIVLVGGLILLAAVALVWSQIQDRKEAQEDMKAGRRRW